MSDGSPHYAIYKILSRDGNRFTLNDKKSYPYSRLIESDSLVDDDIVKPKPKPKIKKKIEPRVSLKRKMKGKRKKRIGE